MTNRTFREKSNTKMYQILRFLWFGQIIYIVNRNQFYLRFMCMIFFLILLCKLDHVTSLLITSGICIDIKT